MNPVIRPRRLRTTAAMRARVREVLDDAAA